jgi:hypothetical protein
LSEEDVGDRGHDERQSGEDVEREAPGVVAHAQIAAPVDQVRRGHDAERETDGQTGDHDAEADGAPGGRGVVEDQRAVVGVEDALAETGQDAGGDEGDQAGDQTGHGGHDAGPDQGHDDHLAVAVLVTETPAGVLREHVAGEEHRADQAAERGRVGRVADEPRVVPDHPGDHRTGHGAVGVADHPAQQQHRPQRAVRSDHAAGAPGRRAPC